MVDFHSDTLSYIIFCFKGLISGTMTYVQMKIVNVWQETLVLSDCFLTVLKYTGPTAFSN